MAQPCSRSGWRSPGRAPQKWTRLAAALRAAAWQITSRCPCRSTACWTPNSWSGECCNTVLPFAKQLFWRWPRRSTGCWTPDSWSSESAFGCFWPGSCAPLFWQALCHAACLVRASEVQGRRLPFVTICSASRLLRCAQSCCIYRRARKPKCLRGEHHLWGVSHWLALACRLDDESFRVTVPLDTVTGAAAIRQRLFA